MIRTLPHKQRGTGRTTKQIQDAPAGAIFIWCNSHISYPQSLAKHLGRHDLQTVSLAQGSGSWLLGVEGPVVVDHAALLPPEALAQIEFINDRKIWK